MIAGGTLYLSKQNPVASTAADGQFGLTLLAYDRQGYKQVEPWRLIWMGADAHAFYQVHARDLVAGAQLEVSVASRTQRRARVSRPGQKPVPAQGLLTMTPQAMEQIRMNTPHDHTFSLELEQIRIEAQKSAWLYDNINDACPYPFGSVAAATFKEAFLTAQDIQRALLAKTPQATSAP